MMSSGLITRQPGKVDDDEFRFNNTVTHEGP